MVLPAHAASHPEHPCILQILMQTKNLPQSGAGAGEGEGRGGSGQLVAAAGAAAGVGAPVPDFVKRRMASI